jgi:hypothetical protein
VIHFYDPGHEISGAINSREFFLAKELLAYQGLRGVRSTNEVVSIH